MKKKKETKNKITTGTPLPLLESIIKEFEESFSAYQKDNLHIQDFIVTASGLIKLRIPFTQSDFLKMIEAKDLPKEEIKLLFSKFTKLMTKRGLLNALPAIVYDEEVFTAI